MSEINWYWQAVMILRLVILGVAVRMFIRFTGRQHGMNTDDIENDLKDGMDIVFDQIKSNEKDVKNNRDK